MPKIAQEKVEYYKNLIFKIQNQGKELPKGGIADSLKGVVESIAQNTTETIYADLKRPIPRQNWKRISLNALKEIDSFSTTYDIYEFLIDKSPEFIQYDKSDVVSKISTALSNLYSKNAIKRIKNTLGRGYFWALSSWYSDDVYVFYKSKLLQKYSVDESAFFDPVDEYDSDSININEDDLSI